MARLEHLANVRKSRTEIEALQRRKFRRLVAHAARHSAYYRDLIAEHGIDPARCGPSDFPPLTKTIMMENFDRLVTDSRITATQLNAFIDRSRSPGERFLDEYVVLHSSGSSGLVGFFVYSPRDWARGAALRMRTWPFSFGRRRLAFYGMSRGHFGGISAATATGRSVARLRFRTEIFDVNDPMSRAIEGLNRYQPESLAGYPSLLDMLADAQADGRLNIAPRFVVSGGQPLTKETREKLGRVFRATVLNVYASAEVMMMGLGRSDYGGMYLFEDELIFEIEEDRIFVTSLFNFTQPMIRYEMDDRLEVLDDPSPLLPFTKIKEPGDRPRPNPVFTNKHGEDDFIAGPTFVEFFAPNVEQAQLRVVDKSSCVLRVRLKEGLSNSAREEAIAGAERALAEIFAGKDMENVERRIEVVERFGGNKFHAIVTPEMAAADQYMVG